MMLKAHQKIIVQAALIGVLISTYDVLLHSLLVFLHIAFEWFELGLEELIEHVFHATRRQSQIVVFYLILAGIAFALYRLWRAAPRFYSYLQGRKATYIAAISRYWQEGSLVEKAKLITVCSAGFAGICFWVFT
jgi:hypothetical protein